MLYHKAKVNNGHVKNTKSIEVDQNKLTADCWMIQLEGAKACEKCKHRDQPHNCGGMAIRKKLGVPAPMTRALAKKLKTLSKSLRFSGLKGDMNWMSFGGKWVSNKLNNGDFDYYLVLEINNLIDTCGEKEAKEMGGTYMVSLSAVAPSEVLEAEAKNAMKSFDVNLDFNKMDAQMQVEVLHSYGIRSEIWNGTGNNARKLLKEARQHAREEGTKSFNESLSRFANKIGHTGADCLRGDLSMETALKNRNALNL
jgi:hypothetical protein